MEEIKGFVSARDALAALEQYQGCFFPHSTAVKIINQLSREDVEPVVHAHWICKPIEADLNIWMYHCANSTKLQYFMVSAQCLYSSTSA